MALVALAVLELASVLVDVAGGALHGLGRVRVAAGVALVAERHRVTSLELEASYGVVEADVRPTRWVVTVGAGSVAELSVVRILVGVAALTGRFGGLET